MTTKNINLTLSVPPDTRNQIRELSFIQDKTHSAIVSELIEAEYRKVKAQQVLDNEENFQDPDEQKADCKQYFILISSHDFFVKFPNEKTDLSLADSAYSIGKKYFVKIAEKCLVEGKRKIGRNENSCYLSRVKAI